jgi:hypothetical protein
MVERAPKQIRESGELAGLGEREQRLELVCRFVRRRYGTSEQPGSS